jgi:hypothetical protein
LWHCWDSHDGGGEHPVDRHFIDFPRAGTLGIQAEKEARPCSNHCSILELSFASGDPKAATPDIAPGGVM